MAGGTSRRLVATLRSSCGAHGGVVRTACQCGESGHVAPEPCATLFLRRDRPENGVSNHRQGLNATDAAVAAALTLGHDASGRQPTPSKIVPDGPARKDQCPNRLARAWFMDSAHVWAAVDRLIGGSEIMCLESTRPEGVYRAASGLQMMLMSGHEGGPVRLQNPGGSAATQVGRGSR
jgi:hypothetical protein